MSYRTCDHLKEDGVFCSSPAFRDQRYCYFRLNARAGRAPSAASTASPPTLAQNPADAA